MEIRYKGNHMYLDKQEVLENGLKVIAEGIKEFKEEANKTIRRKHERSKSRENPKS